jgi:hypothetical protein
MGTRTCDTVPGLNRHVRNVLVVTPVILARFAWYGYSGKGALIAKAWVPDNDKEWESKNLLAEVVEPREFLGGCAPGNLLPL